MPPKFTVPSYNIFLVNGLIHTLIGGFGLILLKTTWFPLSVRDFILPALDESPAADFALSQTLTVMLFFIGLPGLFIYRNNGQDRKYYVPVAIPYALYHLFNLLNLFSSFLIEEVPTFGPAQGVLPPIIGSLLNQLVKTYRIRLWIVTALTHFVLYVWYIIWVVRVQESGGIPGHRLVKSKKE